MVINTNITFDIKYCSQWVRFHSFYYDYSCIIWIKTIWAQRVSWGWMVLVALEIKFSHSMPFYIKKIYKCEKLVFKLRTLFRYDFSVTFNFYDSVTFIKTDSSVLSNLFYKKVICQDFVVIFHKIIKYFAKNETFSMKIFLYIFTSLF